MHLPNGSCALECLHTHLQQVLPASFRDEVIQGFYKAVPDGVVNDRWLVTGAHAETESARATALTETEIAYVWPDIMP